MKQRDRFLHGEADAFHVRNGVDGAALRERVARDPLLLALAELDLTPKSVLEIGAGDGWRLAALRESEPAARYVAVEPSALAASACARGVHGARATAERLPFEDASFDLVLFGFCLYLVDRSDLFQVAAEADRVLCEGGTVVVYDFHSKASHRRCYAHADGCFSYKMDHARMFDWNPAYRRVLERRSWHAGSEPGDEDAELRVVALRRDIEAAWPTRQTGRGG